MKRLAIITALILAATILAAGRIALPVQSDVETISGTVARADTRMPLPHVQLELLRESDKRLPTGHEKACRPDSQSGPSDRRRLATTDENGKFEFENVAAGRYYLFAEHEGFLTAAYGQRGHFPIPQVLEVASHADRTLLVSDSGRVDATVFRDSIGGTEDQVVGVRCVDPDGAAVAIVHRPPRLAAIHGAIKPPAGGRIDQVG